MTKKQDTAAAASTRPGRNRYVVNAGRDMLETEIQADDYEIDGNGVHFWMEAEGDAVTTIAFVSHPCMVQLDNEGAAAAKREVA